MVTAEMKVQPYKMPQPHMGKKFDTNIRKAGDGKLGSIPRAECSRLLLPENSSVVFLAGHLTTFGELVSQKGFWKLTVFCRFWGCALLSKHMMGGEGDVPLFCQSGLFFLPHPQNATSFTIGNFFHFWRYISPSSLPPDIDIVRHLESPSLHQSIYFIFIY